MDGFDARQSARAAPAYTDELIRRFGARLAGYLYDLGPNGIGHRSNMSDASGGQSAWTYDARGRVIQQVDVIPGMGAYATSWTYDSADQVTSMTYPSGEVVTFGNLPQGSVSSISTSLSTQDYLASASYDAAGRATHRLLGNNVENTWSYNAWGETNQGGRLATAGAVLGAANLQNLSYGYDKVGNITSLGDSVANENLIFGYDALNRLDLVTGAYSDDPAYDGRGNLAQKKDLNGATVTLAYPTGSNPIRPHAVNGTTSSNGNTDYQYDDNGNMTRRTIGGITYSLAYDQENRLTSITGSGLNAGYTYNADGIRVKATVTIGSVTKITGYVGSYFEISTGQPRPSTPGTPPNCTPPVQCSFVPLVSNGRPYLSPGQAWYSYYYAGASRIGMRIQSNQLNLDDALVYFLSDHLGGTTVTLDEDGNQIAELRYTAWGETRYADGATPTQRKYTGQLEAEAGLYFFNARWMDPYLGRFAQADTIIPNAGNPLAWDRYAYSGNNSINYNDPTGHMSSGDDGKGGDREGILYLYAVSILNELGGKDDLEALAQIIDKAYDLYGTYDQMIPAISGIILGKKESNTYTVFNAAFNNTGCAGVGRDPIDCPANKPENGGRSFVDEGFHKDFRDGHNQLFHVWAYISTTMATEDGILGSGITISYLANITHEVIWQETGSSWQDYSLASAGMEIGILAKTGVISPAYLGTFIRIALGPNGGGSFGFVPFLNSIAPLPWFMQ